MTMKPFAYAEAASVQEVVGVLSEDCRPLAGGTDLLGLMKADLAAPERLVNLKTISGLNTVAEHDDGWHIGALMTLAQLAADRAVNGQRELNVLYEALLHTASPQLRHMATLGGNLVQKPRCWYYRNPLTHCWRKGGEFCFAYRGENKFHVILNGGPCYTPHPSDPVMALEALDASVILTGPSGTRAMPLTAFYRRPSGGDRSDNVLAVNEVITEVLIPPQPHGARGAYVKVAERATWDFALASAAVQVILDGGMVQAARIALGGVSLIPYRATQAEQALVGQRLSAETINAAAEAAVSGARPLEDNGYKVDLLRGVVREALARVAE